QRQHGFSGSRTGKGRDARNNEDSTRSRPGAVRVGIRFFSARVEKSWNERRDDFVVRQGVRYNSIRKPGSEEVVQRSRDQSWDIWYAKRKTGRGRNNRRLECESQRADAGFAK